jgi:hypothetical protein
MNGQSTTCNKAETRRAQRLWELDDREMASSRSLSYSFVGTAGQQITEVLRRPCLAFRPGREDAGAL